MTVERVTLASVSSIGAVDAGSPVGIERFERFERLDHLPARLGNAASVGELFARGAELLRREAGFDRALVLAAEARRLTAGASDVLLHPESERLRGEVLNTPVPLVPGTEEAERLRSADAKRAAEARPSILAERLGLRNFALGVIAPEREALALLVADRADGPTDALDHAYVSAFAGLLSMALEHLVVDARLAQVSAELRHLTVSAQALMTEVRHAPITLPRSHGTRSAFPLVSGVEPVDRPAIGELLTDREATVAALLARGHSNREIAEHLVLSPETVKGHVARILRKLDASNRVEAVARYLELLHSAS